MKIIIGKTSGFCAGVLNAVTKTEKELDKEGGKIYCLGELVHNRQVVEKLENKGLETIENIENADKKTIIRAHGVAKEVYEKAMEKQIELIDLTCPKVLQIHKIAEEYAENGYYIFLIGVENHPESIGTISFCGNKSYLIRNKEDINEAIIRLEESQINKVYIIAQTTYSLKKFEEIVFNLAKDPITGLVYYVSGDVVNWEPGQPRNKVWDLGHRPGQEYKKMHEKYMNDEMTDEEFEAWYNDPTNYRVEDSSSNRGHKDESHI